MKVLHIIGILTTLLHLITQIFATTNKTTTTPLPPTTLPLTTVPPTPVQPLASTDTPCSETVNPCKISEGQVCLEGVCKCAYSNLTYDTQTKKCMAKVGDQCGFSIGLENASVVACPQNATCALHNLEISSHKCACIYTHYKTDEGTCAPLPKFGETCNEKVKCSFADSELICVNHTCQCQFEGDQYFDTERGTCVSFAGGNCTRACVSNSVCDYWGTGTCQCRVDHRPNANRQCELIPPGYLSPCLGENELCNIESGLKCIDKVCQCANPLHQMYDFQLDKCIGLAGDICDPNLPDNCVKNSECVKSSEVDGAGKSSFHVCNCKEGYSTTPFRKCMKSHKQECSNEFCNVYRGLACVNGSCECYDSFLRYDDTSQACISSLGSPCGKVFVPFPGDWVKKSCPECDSYYFACDSESICTRDFTEGNELGALEKFRCQPKNIMV